MLDCAPYNLATECQFESLSIPGLSRTTEDVACGEVSDFGCFRDFKRGIGGDLHTRNLCLIVDGNGNAVLCQVPIGRVFRHAAHDFGYYGPAFFYAIAANMLNLIIVVTLLLRQRSHPRPSLKFA